MRTDLAVSPILWPRDSFTQSPAVESSMTLVVKFTVKTSDVRNWPSAGFRSEHVRTGSSPLA